MLRQLRAQLRRELTGQRVGRVEAHADTEPDADAAFHAWAACGPLAAETGRAFANRVVAEAFAADVEDASLAPLPLRPALRRLLVLLACHLLHSEAAYSHNGIMSPTACRAVATELSHCLADLAPVAVDVVAGFGIPDHLMPPIAGDYVAHNSRARAATATEGEGRLVMDARTPGVLPSKL